MEKFNLQKKQKQLFHILGEYQQQFDFLSEISKKLFMGLIQQEDNYPFRFMAETDNQNIKVYVVYIDKENNLQCAFLYQTSGCSLIQLSSKQVISENAKLNKYLFKLGDDTIVFMDLNNEQFSLVSEDEIYLFRSYITSEDK